MTIQSRTPFKLKHPGPYIAIVKNYLDPGYMGGLEVALIKGTIDNTDQVSSQSLKVKYLSPFYGVTNINHVNPADARDFGGTQKAYGMWMVPPDIGTKVMVIFINGESNQGYWIGCVPEPFQNHMVPGIAAQELPTSWLTQDQITNYGAGNTYLPVAEYNRKATSQLGNIAGISRPVHPFADRLAQQGLLADTVRGVTSSSARREIPSMVFGISTPGPLDPNGPSGEIAYGGKSTAKLASRLGGTTFVMDDGDEAGQNELVRIRTRTGHQILMHNTSDLIYIANAQGTAWIELTGNGKIDIYAKDSVSIHSEADFNFRADRDVNIEAGRNVNINAFADVKLTAAKNNVSIYSEKSTVITGNKTVFINSVGNVEIAATANTNIGGKTVGLNGTSAVNLTGGTVNSNNPGAPAPTPGATAAEAPTLYEVPFKSGKGSWANEYDAGTLNTILQRVPTHEPWQQHESLNPELYQTENLDPTPPDPDSDYTPQGPLPNPNKVSKIDATGALVFTSGSGDVAHFNKTTPELQAALKAAAIEFKEKTGRPVVVTSSYRDYSEQKKIYSGWVAAGGSKTNPTVTVPGVGKVSTPVNPDSPSWPNAHARGIAFDSPNAAEMDRLGVLSRNGFYRPIPGPDPVHAMLRTPPPAPGRPTSNQPPINRE